MRSALLQFAIETAVEAGRTAMQYHRRAGVHMELKADRSLLTEADQAAEALIAERIASAWPDHCLIGEETIGRQPPEYHVHALEAPHTWVVDPIDGTANFAAGLPMWCVSIALLEAGRPVLGVTYFPALNDELYYNDGAELMVVRRPGAQDCVPAPALELVPRVPDFVMLYETFHERFRLERPYLPRMSGSMVLNFLWVVLGQAVGAITSAHIWDFAAPLAFAHAAGMQLIRLDDGVALDRFGPGVLHLDPARPRGMWCLRGHHVLARPGHAESIRGAIQLLPTR